MASSPRAEEVWIAQVRTSRETSVRCGEVENQVPAVPDPETSHRAGLRLEVATLQDLNEFSTCRDVGIVGSSHFRFLIMFHLTGQTAWLHALIVLRRAHVHVLQQATCSLTIFAVASCWVETDVLGL